MKVDRIGTNRRKRPKEQDPVREPDAAAPDAPPQLERDMRGEENTTSRIIDMIAPIGAGQRGLLVAPPKSGKR